MKMLAVRNFFSTSHLYFPADLTRSVYFHVPFHCHYFPSLVLVSVFKSNCSLSNRLPLKLYIATSKKFALVIHDA